jgi:hypothetical protein
VQIPASIIKKKENLMSYEEWLDKHYDERYADCAENGSFGELDFDFEMYCEDQYEIYEVRIKWQIK